MFKSVCCCVKTRHRGDVTLASSASSQYPKLLPQTPERLERPETSRITTIVPPKSRLRTFSSMGTMKEAHVQPDTSVTLHNVPIPSITHPYHLVSFPYHCIETQEQYHADSLQLIKVHATSCNPKDWKMALGTLMTISSCPNSGDNIAGTIVSVGSAVHDFKPSDRVAALHELGTQHAHTPSMPLRIPGQHSV